MGSLVVSWALWVLPLRGPCWTRNAQVREVNGVWGAQGCGVLTWECAGSLAGGNISSFCPPGWDRAAFFCDCGCKGSGWPSGESGGGCLESTLPRSHPLSGDEEQALVPGGEWFPMIGYAFPVSPDSGTRVPVLPRGLLPLL